MILPVLPVSLDLLFQMPSFDILIPLLGILLCVFALGHLGLWAAQSLRISSQNQEQFELAKELLRSQIQSQASSTARAPLIRAVDVATRQASKAKGFRKLQVIKIVQEAAQCRSVYFRPVDGQPIECFQAGQHLPLRLSIPGHSAPVLRCYSLSNAYGEGHYRISVKAVPAPRDQPGAPAGLVSNFVNTELCVGDIVEAKSPAGKFTLRKESTEPIVMLAGGIGITPMVSMIQEAINENNWRLMILVYGVNNRSEQAFREWLDEKNAEHENLVVVNCFSAPTPDDRQGEDYQVPGWVNVDLLKQLLPSQDCQYYLCGPPPFMDSLTDGLAEWGVSDSRIFSETFGPAARKKNRTDNDQSTSLATSSQVRFVRSGIEANFVGDQTLLEVAESAGVDIDSGCRAGNCETCLTRILNGQVRYPGGESPKVGANECLPCIAEPASDLELDL
jgi:ferredoxin-NADP reductase